MNSLRWLYPGLGVKRWVLLLLIGIGISGLGVGLFLSGLFLRAGGSRVLYYLEKLGNPGYLPGTILAALGVVLTLLAIWQLGRIVLSLSTRVGRGGKLVDTLYTERFLQRGPRVVAIGGGTGLSTLLRGLKEYTNNLTAIVTVADDGGSSGRLRRELGMLPPGDFRNCIVALSEVEPLVTRLFQYRFSEGMGLEGHSFGNLFIVAMCGVTGSFEEAIKESSRVLAVRGRILPSSVENVTLYARMEDKGVVYGESSITERGGKIKEVYIDPPNVEAFPEAVKAVKEADLVVLGPGSLYTSILPNLLVRGIREALVASPALKVYACNVATQKGETDGYTAGDHIATLYRHVGPGLFSFVLVNSDTQVLLPAEWGVSLVFPDGAFLPGVKLAQADIIDREYGLRHEPGKLASALMKLYHDNKKKPFVGVWEPI